jgi:hypothetical protein
MGAVRRRRRRARRPGRDRRRPVRHRRPAGGSLSLPGFLAQWWEALEADWQARYRRDLAQDCYGQTQIGVRKLLALIKGLPPDGALARASLGEAAGWGYEQELLATTVDLLGYLTYLTKAAHFKGRHELPKPVPRPGGLPGQTQPEPEPVRFSTREEIRQFFQGPGTRAVHAES